jgi:hypothetical protein
MPQLQRLLASLAFLGLVAWRSWKQWNRASELQKAAPSLGFSYEAKPDGLDPELLELLRRWSGRATLGNVLRDPVEDAEALLFDYTWSPYAFWLGSPIQTVAAFWGLGRTFPRFAMTPETRLDRLGARLGLQDLDFATHPRFSANYRLRAQQDVEIGKVFGARELDYFEKESCWAVEGGGRWLLVYRPHVLVPPGRLLPFLGEARGIAELFRHVAVRLEPGAGEAPPPDRRAPGVAGPSA